MTDKQEQTRHADDFRLSRVYCYRKRIGIIFALIVFLNILQSGCESPKSSEIPTIEFTKIPPAAQGGREREDTVSGRVRGARPGQKVVVYARSGP